MKSVEIIKCVSTALFFEHVVSRRATVPMLITAVRIARVGEGGVCTLAVL
jgi:hypothetical protein